MLALNLGNIDNLFHQKKLWDCLESNPGPLGAKLEYHPLCYATPSPPLQCLFVWYFYVAVIRKDFFLGVGVSRTTHLTSFPLWVILRLRYKYWDKREKKGFGLVRNIQKISSSVIPSSVEISPESGPERKSESGSETKIPPKKYFNKKILSSWRRYHQKAIRRNLFLEEEKEWEREREGEGEKFRWHTFLRSLRILERQRRRRRRRFLCRWRCSTMTWTG